jgi:hypothetical protein
MTITDNQTRSAGNRGRVGKPYSLRLTEEERRELDASCKAAREHMPYSYGNHRQHGSMSHFIVWAALQWKPPAATTAGLRVELQPGTTRRRRAVVPRRRRPAKRSGRKPAKRSKKGGRK